MVYQQDNGKWAYKHSCGKKQTNFADEKAAQITLRLHMLGCKK